MINIDDVIDDAELLYASFKGLSNGPLRLPSDQIRAVAEALVTAANRDIGRINGQLVMLRFDVDLVGQSIHQLLRELGKVS